MFKIARRLKLHIQIIALVSLLVVLVLVAIPHLVYAQAWPPFDFSLTPSHESGQISYQIRLSSDDEGAMKDIAIKISVPEGTRFLTAGAPPTTEVQFNGQEVIFFTAITHDTIKDAYFLVEIIDPSVTTYTTQAWISWKGDQPGDYLTEEESFDITLPPLNWVKPRPRVELNAAAAVAEDGITYTIYPQKLTSQRIWDFKVNVPIPPGTTFLSAEALAPFTTSFDGKEVSFFVAELNPQAEARPLRFKISTDGITSTILSTHAWASWKNVGRRVGQSIPFQEDISSGNVIVQPHASQQVVSDMIGDAAFANYDLTSVALQQEGQDLKVTLYTVGAIGPVGEPLDYRFYIDRDCRSDTGKLQRSQGFEYRVRYRHDRGEAYVSLWGQEEAEDEELGWSKIDAVEVRKVIGEQTVTVWVPLSLLGDSGGFCWLAEARNRTDAFASRPRTERVPNQENLRLQFEFLTQTMVVSNTEIVSTD